jgi:hypothetical protein
MTIVRRNFPPILDDPTIAQAVIRHNETPPLAGIRATHQADICPSSSQLRALLYVRYQHVLVATTSI